jgi:predicted nucleic acid-binding protein
MIILDTNVISEAMLPSPSSIVMGWLAARPAVDLATTTISIAEVGFGLARLPFGRRRTERERMFNNFCQRAFGDRIFGFDRLAADAYGDLIAARERSGRPLLGFDGLIAAIAASRGLGIATRDIGGFEGCGIQVFNPWDSDAV